MRSRLPIILLLVILLSAEGVARIMEPRLPRSIQWENQFTQTKADQIAVRSAGETRVVYLGSSVVNADIDPDLVAAASLRSLEGYNAGLPAYTPRVWDAWFRDVVGPQLCAPLVMIGVDIRQFNDNKPGAANQLQAYMNSRGRRLLVDPTIFDSGLSAMQEVSALVRIRDRLREPDNLLAWFTGIGDPGDWRRLPVSSSGRYLNFDDNRYQEDVERIDELRTGAFRNLEMGGIEADALESIISTAQQAGASVAIVEMPSMKSDLVLALPEGIADFERFSAIIDDIAERREIPVLRFPELDDDPALFADEYHMNRIGVERLAVMLASVLDAIPAPDSPRCTPGPPDTSG